MEKILHYTDTPQVGGAELQIFLLAKFLNKDKYEPIIAVSNYRSLDRWCENFEKEGIKVIRMPVKHKHDPKHLFQLNKIIKEEKIDILHAHVWNPASCRYAFLASKKNKIPMMITEHDPFKLSKFKNLIKKISLKQVSKIVTVSRDNKKVIDELYPKHSEKTVVIHNGIDTTWWQSQLLRVTSEEISKIKTSLFRAHKDTFIITCVAELHERKGQETLLRALPLVLDQFPNVKTVFIGTGPNADHLKKVANKLGIENHVIFLGHQKEVPKLLKASNLFVLPSNREAFGLVNLEAMLTPLPIIASRVGGIPEIIQDGKTGILVTPGSISDMEKALLRIIDSPSLRKDFKEAGLKRASEQFSAKKMAEEYERIYEEM